MILYIKIVVSTQKCLEIINKFSKLEGHKMQVAFLYTNNYLKKKLKMDSIIIESKTLQYLGIKPTNKMKYLYAENYKILREVTTTKKTRVEKYLMFIDGRN